jgi:hypothetical protein
MNVLADRSARSALFARVKNLLVQPKTEWPVIETEPATIAGIYSKYIVILAAIPPLCTLMRSLVFGYGVGGIDFRPSVSESLATALLQYGLQLGGIYFLALIIDALAPRFGGRSERVSAFKLAAYSATASWLAGAFTLIPGFGILSLLGLYSLYLLYTGAPVLARVPESRAFAYTTTIVVTGMVIGLVIAILSTCVLSGSVSRSEVGGTLRLPGGVSVDMRKLEQAAEKLEQATDRMAQSVPGGAGQNRFMPGEGELKAPEPIAADQLKGLLPEGLSNGSTRSDVSTWTGGAVGMALANAKATYGQGEGAISLSLIDMGAVGAFMALGTAFGANASEETETRYSKIGKVDGQMTIEEFDKETKVGKFAILVKDRIMVVAESAGASMDDLKSAVAAVNPAHIEALIK